MDSFAREQPTGYLSSCPSESDWSWWGGARILPTSQQDEITPPTPLCRKALAWNGAPIHPSDKMNDMNRYPYPQEML